MARLVYFAPPFYGHVNPALAIVRALAQQGHEVHFFCTAEFAPALSQSGVAHSYRTRLTARGLALRDQVFGTELTTQIDALHARVGALKPDLIIADYFCVWGRALALALRLPELTVHATYAPPRPALTEQRGFAENQQLAAMVSGALLQSSKANLRRLDPWEVLLGQQRAELICTIPELQPAPAKLQVPHAFTGPCIDAQRAQATLSLPTDRPVIYVSHSTLAGQSAGLRDLVLRSLTGPNHLLIAAGNAPPQPRFSNLQVRFLGHAPQLAALRVATAFVTHGGHASVMESLHFGVPMICLPETPEQQQVSVLVRRCGIGVMPEPGKPIGTPFLRAALHHIIQPVFREQVRTMSEKVKRDFSLDRAVAAMVAQALG